MKDKVKLYAVKNDKGEYWDYNRSKWSTNEDGNFTCSLTNAKLKKLKDGDSSHVVTLVEEQKVKLPREVGEELDEWMFDNKDSSAGRIGELILDITYHEPELFHVFRFVGDSEENYFKIIDAYRYGWEAETEELFYVKVPENWGTGLTFTWVTMKYGGFDLINKEDAKTFTRAELKQYHLDSDIFTLVPVEDEK